MRNSPQNWFSKGLLLASLGAGLTWISPEAAAQDLLVSSASGNRVLRFSWPTGASLGAFVPAGSGGLSGPSGLRYGPSGSLFVASNGTNSVIQYDGGTGALIATFVASGSGGLINPMGLDWGSNGNLYLTGGVLGINLSSECVRQYSGATGAFVGLGPCEDSISNGAYSEAIAFHPDGRFYVAWQGLPTLGDAIAEYTATGALVRYFDLSDVCRGLTVGPTGEYLFASQWIWDNILRINLATGASSVFASGGGLDGPEGVVFAPNGNLCVIQWITSPGVREYDGTTGAFVRLVCSTGSDLGQYLTFMAPPPPPGELSVSPTAPFFSAGPQGGPFLPPSNIYTITNIGGTPVNYTADDDVAWITTSPTSGTLAPGAGELVTVTINAGADGLAPGVYPAMLEITNTTNGLGSMALPIALTVLAPAPTFFMGLGDLPGGIISSTAWGISADGSTVAGFSESGAGEQGFRWTLATGLVALPGGVAPGPSRGRRVSGDGAMVAGSQNLGAGARQAVRWSAAGGTTPLGDLPGGPFVSEAFGVSDDGTVVVGYGTNAFGVEQAFRWTAAGGMVPLPIPPISRAHAISADGSLAVGYEDLPPITRRAIAWPAAGGFIPLGDVPAGIGYSEANEVSANGTYVVGYAVTVAGDMAFRWTVATGMVPLGFLPGLTDSRAWDVSADGTLVVGASYAGGGVVAEAFVWDVARGMRSVAAEAASYGVTVPPAWTLWAAMGIAVNGPVVTIEGNGLNPAGEPEAWIVRFSRAGDLNCDGLINAFDIDPFVLALTDPAGYTAAFASCNLMNADINGDGVVNAFDIDPFVVCITLGACP